MTQDPLFPTDPKKRKPRPRDPVWDALCDLHHPPTNKVERGRMNKAVEIMKESLEFEGHHQDSYVDQYAIIRKRWARMVQVWADIVPTPMCLANHWSLFMPPEPTDSAYLRRYKEEDARMVRASPKELAHLRQAIYDAEHWEEDDG